MSASISNLPSSITISDPTKTRSVTVDLATDECHDLMVLANKENRKCFNIFEALVVPVRTNSFEVFAKDLFAPTFFRVLDQTESTALRTLKLIGALFLDLLTLPIRLITALPRYLTSESVEQNKFYQELEKMSKTEDLLQELIRYPYVHVSFLTPNSVTGQKNSYSLFHRFEQMHEFTDFDMKMSLLNVN